MLDNEVKIAKGGKLVKDIYDHKSKTCTKDVDSTSLILFSLNDTCEIEDGVTLKDILLLIKNIDLYPVLSPMLTGGTDWLEEIVTEGLTKTPKINDSDYVKLDNIIIGRRVELHEDYSDKTKTEIYGGLDVVAEKIGDKDKYAIDFTPVCELLDCNIKLDTSFVIYDERRKQQKAYWKKIKDLPEEERAKLPMYEIILNTQKVLTLYEVLQGLFFELSFHGSPVERDERADELKKSMEEIDNGTAKLIPWEEIKERLHLTDDDEE